MAAPGRPFSFTAGLRALPAGIWALGFGSMLMDISSELIHSLLPLFMVGVLGTSLVTVGIVEGVAEATAAFAKVFSGALSDYLGRRKRLMVFGYALAAFSKPLFPLATSVDWVFAARFADRVGKGIRGAPRDALVADIVPPRLRGAAYGLRQALDSLGAVIGPLLALLFMFWFANDIAAVMWVAVIPAFLTVALLLRYVREPARVGAEEGARPPLRLGDVRRLGGAYWRVVGIGAVFTLARFSEAFLILRVEDVGVPLGLVPLALVVMNLFYALCAYPAGQAADRLDARRLLLLSLLLLILADLLLAGAGSPWLAFAGAALWGLHMAFSQGLLAKLVADSAPLALRGTAFGFFNLLSGLALLAASLIAGALWQQFGAAATFLAGAAFAVLAALGLLGWRVPGGLGDGAGR
ncbi:MFS transporter [Azotobacter chroococcum]|uniref:Na+/melibiose symporter-like transporter n=1 Tax=Azotobacter chroococcum TaxID=353 RepID=A0A4R1PU26_9GAMM|nr:MFS transporter [Azotobacter chroococcum]TBV96199.1 MFS transporter [Azotobacter chroococcum]TCL34266.1 Na+/melibiose symporter-like transporter [Azotobacter chroococcum]